MTEFTWQSDLPFPAHDVFAWHERPGALERLLPPWEPVELIAREGGLAPGSMVTLRVGVGPAAVTWKARHVELVRGQYFVDEQVEGPFARWVHRHAFEPTGAGSSRMIDLIAYEPPLGAVGAMADRLLIRHRLERQFRYRHATVREDLEAHRRAALPPMRIAISGASGMIGTALGAFLQGGGHEVVPMVRGEAGPGEIAWDPDAGTVAPGAMDGIDAVVHLAGEPIGSRWSAEKKDRIRQSRVIGTRAVAEAMATASPRPRVLVSVSACGIYGQPGEPLVTEHSPPGSDYLSAVAVAWEAAAGPAAEAGIRVVHPRFGMVLSPAGGALGRMLPVFRAGAGGHLGSGEQWMSWISLDDAIGLILHALATPDLHGPVNAVSPDPVRNRVFTEILGEVLGRPTVLAVPAVALRLAFGEMADALLLTGARVEPAVASASGYRFRHPDLRLALRHLLGHG